MKTKELGGPRGRGKHPQGQSKGRDEGGGKESQRKPQKGLRKTQLLSRCFSVLSSCYFPLSYHIHASSGKRQRERRQDS